MQRCKLTISTTMDGQKTEFSTYGEMQLFPRSAKLSYRQENATVNLTFEDCNAQIERRGDYDLRLSLQENVVTKGVIGIGGNEGEIKVQSHCVQYSIGRDSLLAILHYDLIIGDEAQNMNLRLLARFCN